MVKALPNTSFLPVPKSAPAGHTTAAAHLLWQVFPRYPCLEYKDNSGQSCPVRYTWTASFGCGLMFWQKWFNLTPQFVAYQFPGHLLHPHWYFTAYSSICQVLLGALNGILWIARSGARWEDLPARYGPHQTVYSCFCRWRDDGTLERIFHALGANAELEELNIDSTTSKVSEQASRGPRKR